MPALTIWQPWASLIFAGKTVENRGWRPSEKLIGQRIAIHAGLTFEPVLDTSDLDEKFGRDYFTQAVNRCVAKYGRLPAGWPCGAVLGTVRLAGVIRPLPEGALEVETANDAAWWETDQFGWVLRDPIAFDAPIPARGRQGIWMWDVPEGVDVG